MDNNKKDPMYNEETKKTNKRKGPNGLGTVYENKARGCYVGQLPATYNQNTGKMQRKTIYGKTEKEVVAKMKKILAEISNGTYQSSGDYTVGSWLDLWLSNMKIGLESSTYNSYEASIRLHIKPGLGRIKLDRLTNQDIQNLVNIKSKSGRSDGKEGGLGYKSLKNIVDVLGGALKDAVINRHLVLNPLVKIKLPPNKGANVRRKAFTNEELEIFLKAIKDNPYELEYKFALYSGLRRGEILGLQYRDIDFQNGYMTIIRQVTGDGRQIILKNKLKTEKSGGQFPLSEIALRTIKQQKIKQMELFLKIGLKINENDYIFRPLDREYHRPDTFTKSFGKVIKKLSLRKELTVHSLRHTFGSRACDSGMDLKIVQICMRHSDIKQTAAYVDPSTQTCERAMDVLSEEFKKLDMKPLAK